MLYTFFNSNFPNTKIEAMFSTLKRSPQTEQIANKFHFTPSS